MTMCREVWHYVDIQLSSAHCRGDTKSKKSSHSRFEKWINYLLDNLYVQVGDELLLRQVIGIPMGVSCAPYLANLMLFMYELEFFDAFISRMTQYATSPPANCYGNAHAAQDTLMTSGTH